MARMTTTAGGLLRREQGGLRLYHWLWLLACVAGAMAVATPRLLARPVVYQAEATTLLDTGRYFALYDQAGQPNSEFNTAISDAREALRQRALARADVRLGLPTYDVRFVPETAGRVVVLGVGSTAAEAQGLANDGAAELVRQIRAAGGREVMRNLLGHELWLITGAEAAPAASRFDVLLRNILRLQAFPMSRAPEPISTPRTVEGLPVEELSDLARALEARYDLWSAEINARNTNLDSFCQIAPGTTTAAREQLLTGCAATDTRVAAELDARNRAVAGRQAIGDALRYLVDTLDAGFDADSPSAAHRLVATLPEAPVTRQTLPLLAGAALFGLLFGGLGVLVDRRAGALAKLRELWSYRAVVSNLVARDLLSRYKSSMLGFVWTQLSPLLMMLVFWVAFSTLFPSGVAMFPVFLIVGMLPWNLCAEAVSNATQSVTANGNLIKKHYFPREILPITSVLSSLLNYLLSLPMMFVLMAGVQLLYPPLQGRLNFSATIAFLPVIIGIEVIFLIGVCFFLSALAVFFRDAVHLVGILIQIWFFLTPVFYPLENIPGDTTAQIIRWLNPMASLVEFSRGVLYGTAAPYGSIPTPGWPALDAVLRTFVTSLLVLVLGYWFFRRMSGRFGEEI